MATPVQMPQMGESVVEGTILKWLKAEGDTVEMDDPLVEVSTDKVDTEIPSPVAGTLVKILAQEGDSVEVGTAICEVDEAGGAAGGSAAPAEEAKTEAAEAPAETEAAAEPEASAETEAPADAQVPQADGAETKQQPAASGSPVSAPPRQGPPSRENGKPGQALSPLVRRLARENNVDIAQVRGTGQGGRITKSDVLAYVQRPTPQAPASASGKPVGRTVPAPVARSGERDEVKPLGHIRKRIAEHMVKSLHTSARAWNAVDIDMENIAQLRKEVNPAFKASEGHSLTYLPFICRAVVDALAAYPVVNASVSEDLSEAVYHHYVNIGIAVATDYGLIVPVVKDADTMNVVGISRAIRDIAARARSKNLQPDEVTGSTFTITNPGPFGSYLSVPVINQPNVAIIGTEAVEQRVVAVDGMIAVRHRMFISMSWDHRLLDGSDAMNFLARLKENLETWDFSREVVLP